jgi:hypothetical protein
MFLKSNHSFKIYCGECPALILCRFDTVYYLFSESSTVLVDHPPKIDALVWSLRKRCSSSITRELPLRNPHFYSYPFIDNLDESSIGRPLGCLCRPTYGLTPWPAVVWTATIRKGGMSNWEAGASVPHSDAQLNVECRRRGTPRWVHNRTSKKRSPNLI